MSEFDANSLNATIGSMLQRLEDRDAATDKFRAEILAEIREMHRDIEELKRAKARQDGALCVIGIVAGLGQAIAFWWLGK